MKEIDELRARFERVVMSEGCIGDNLKTTETLECMDCGDCIRASLQPYFDMLDAIEDKMLGGER